MGGGHVVLNCVPLVGRGLHRVRSRTLFGEVHHGVRSFHREELRERRIVFGKIEFHEIDSLPGRVLPCFETLGQWPYRCQ